MHDLPGKLSPDQLAELFEGRTRFVERLAEEDSPFGAARRVIATLSDEEKKEALDSHPAIGERREPLSPLSSREQGGDADPQVLAELDKLNRMYEQRFGFRFVVFVNRRPKRDILPVLRRRLGRTREEELATALEELVLIAEDRWLRRS